MSDPYLGEIKLWAGSAQYIPKDWLPCDGRLLQTNQYQALYSLLGNRFGGNGTTTFALPDLRGRMIVGAHTYDSGSAGGAETVALSLSNLPPHTHAVSCSTTPAAQISPANNVPAVLTQDGYRPATNLTGLYAGAVSATGGSEGHENMQPSLVLNYIICMTGTYPPRS